MTSGDRSYDPARDKQWSSEVYHKAKRVIEETLPATGGALKFSDICQVVKQKYPSPCDDSVKDRFYPKVPYWRHLVASAIQILKKQGKVRKADHGSMWVKEKTKQSDDEVVERVKEIGEMLGKTAQDKWGPVYKHDCVWKD